MNFIVNGGTFKGDYLNILKNAGNSALAASSKDVAQALFGVIKAGDTLKSGMSVKTGDVISAELIDASASVNGGFSGIIDINGSFLKSVITEDLFNEFVTGKNFNGSFSIPVRLKLDSITAGTGKSLNYSDMTSGADETQSVSAGASSEFNIVFKVLNETSGQNAADIQRTVDLYGKTVAENIQGKFESILNSLGSENSTINSVLSGEIQNFFQNAAQNISVSIKGNFAFIHINFGGTSGLSTVILTTEDENYKVKNKEKKEGEKNANNSKKKYMFMLEINLNNLGQIKLFSYYSDKTLSVKFDTYTHTFKKFLSQNLELLKNMLFADGIKLNGIFFKSPELNTQGFTDGTDSSADGTAESQAKSAHINRSDQNSYIFLNGKIIDERI